MSILRILAVVLPILPLAAQWSGPALGAEAFQKLLRQYDKNGDKKIERAEYVRTDAAWQSLDRNRDGVLEAQDFETPSTRVPTANVIRDRNAPAATLPKVGDKAPDFELPMLGTKDTKVKLSSFAGKQPVALIFGSWT